MNVPVPSFEMLAIKILFDIPELVWKAAIDLEFEAGDLDRVRDLYERLLERSQYHLKVWVSYANMEVATEQESELNVLAKFFNVLTIISSQLCQHGKTRPP